MGWPVWWLCQMAAVSARSRCRTLTRTPWGLWPPWRSRLSWVLRVALIDSMIWRRGLSWGAPRRGRSSRRAGAALIAASLDDPGCFGPIFDRHATVQRRDSQQVAECWCWPRRRRAARRAFSARVTFFEVVGPDARGRRAGSGCGEVVEGPVGPEGADQVLPGPAAGFDVAPATSSLDSEQAVTVVVDGGCGYGREGWPSRSSRRGPWPDSVAQTRSHRW